MKFYYNQHFWIKTFGALPLNYHAYCNLISCLIPEWGELWGKNSIFHYTLPLHMERLQYVSSERRWLVHDDTIYEAMSSQKRKASWNTLMSENKYLHCFDRPLKAKKKRHSLLSGKKKEMEELLIIKSQSHRCTKCICPFLHLHARLR